MTIEFSIHLRSFNMETLIWFKNICFKQKPWNKQFPCPIESINNVVALIWWHWIFLVLFFIFCMHQIDRRYNWQDIVAVENNREFISPGSGDFRKSGDFYPGDWGFLENWGFLSWGLRIFKIWGFLSPGIGDFWKSGDFYPRGFFGDFYPRDFLGMGIFRRWGFFGDGDLFSWDGDIPPKSHLCRNMAK